MSRQGQENPHGIEYAGMQTHAHWNTYDMDFEGASYNKLHEFAAIGPFDLAAAQVVVTRLEELAHSKGWGEQDSFTCDISGKTRAEVERNGGHEAAKLEMFEDDPDSYFTHCIGLSVRLLQEVAATPEALGFVSGLGLRIDDARTAGRNAYIAAKGPLFAADAPVPGR